MHHKKNCQPDWENYCVIFFQGPTQVFCQHGQIQTSLIFMMDHIFYFQLHRVHIDRFTVKIHEELGSACMKNLFTNIYIHVRIESLNVCVDCKMYI